MKFSVESWDPEYGVPIDADGPGETSETVDVSVEVEAGKWTPIEPPADAPVPTSVAFVDGVRRIDARVWITEDELVHPGVCASVAAGVVESESGSARLTNYGVRRGLVTPARSAGPISTSQGTWSVVPAADGSADTLYLGVHEQMTALEVEVSATTDAELVVIDGPLRGRSAEGLVGYVKTHHVTYLPEDLQVVLGRLEPGQRSPVFLIGGRFTRWSWYLRLPGPKNHPMSGIVRCELPGVGTVDDVVQTVDVATSVLPRFASETHKDTRAPQNLYPIAGLEQELRRRLGDRDLLERGLRLVAVRASTV